MKSKDQILLEQAYSNILNEYHEDDDRTFHHESEIAFNDPFDKPYSYYVNYTTKLESGFYNDEVIGVEIDSAKVYEKDVPDDADEAKFLFDVTNETDPSLSDIHDWVYNYEIGDSKLDVI
jgi:hypothetical protein